MNCYGYYQDDYGFPMHAACLELFALSVTGHRIQLKQLLRSRSKPRGFDKDALYFALRVIGDGCMSSLPVNYGALSIADAGQTWESRRGHECLVAYPGVSEPDGPSGPDDAVTAFLRAHISQSGGYGRSFLAADLAPKVRADPFRRLPYDMIYRVSHFLDDKTLMSLCSASWAVHCALRDNDRFWRQRIRRVSMPWLEEVAPLLRDDALMKNVDIKGLFCALDGLTRLRAGMTGPMMGVANRRRIWRVCRIIAKTYKKMAVRSEAMGSDAVMEQLINLSNGHEPVWPV